MGRHRSPDTPPGPRWGSAAVVRNGRTPTGQQRGDCHGCDRGFGPPLGPPRYRRHTPAPAAARGLLVVLRRGSLSAAEELTGHTYDTRGQRPRAAAVHAEALTAARGHALPLSAVAGDAFWSFVPRSAVTLAATTPRRPGWGRAGAA